MSTRTTAYQRSSAKTSRNKSEHSEESPKAGLKVFTRLLRAGVRRIIADPVWRSVFVILVAAAVFTFPLRNAVAGAAGYGSVLFFAWGAAAFFLLNTRPGSLIARWRLALGFLALGIGITGALGMTAAPLGSAMGQSLGGRIGILVASSPDEWVWGYVTPAQYALASLRVTLVFLIAGAIFAPSLAWMLLRQLFNAAVAAYGWALAAASGLWSKVDSWQFRRSQRKVTTAPRQRPAPSGDINSAGMTDEQLAEMETEFISRRRGGDRADAEPVAPNHHELPSEVSTEAKDGPQEHQVPQVARSAEHSGAHAALQGHAVKPDAPVVVALPARKPQPLPVASVEPVQPPPEFPWKLPGMNSLKVAPPGGVKQAEIDATGELIVDTLSQHGIEVSIDSVRVGPTVTQYGLKPGWEATKPGADPALAKRVRVDTILNREKDLALALKSPSLRFEAPVPGEAVVGVEVPNQKPAMVTMRSVMDTDDWKKFAPSAALPVPLGLATGGEPSFTDLSRMPHLLVAGSTGSGKSVCINAIIAGLLMNRTPYQVRMVMIDPKRVELTPYSGIPHLYTPVVVEPTRAVPILRSLVSEMMERFKTLEAAGVKNIATFNQKSLHKMPYLVIIVDELADLMLTAAGDTERLLVRLAQLGRATGIHLVVATQRPSVDVVTGLIKANFPSRISFAVSSQVDSRTVIDSPGAEKLLGRGDMLFLPVDKPKPQRIQGAFLSDAEIEAVVGFWRQNAGPALPQLQVTVEEEGSAEGFSDNEDSTESIVDKAEALARTQKTLSTSLLQRRLRIGYPRAARLMDELEEKGVVGPGEPGKPRQVLMNR